MTPRIAPCEVCRNTTDRLAAVEQRPRHVFVCSPDCERIFRLRLRAALEDLRPPRGLRRTDRVDRWA